MISLATNASVEDISQTILGIAAFTPLLLASGYLLNRATGVLVKRGESLIDTLGASLVLSVSVLPVFLHLLGRISMPATRIIFWSSVAVFMIMLWTKRRSLIPAIGDRGIRWCVLVALLWTAIAIALQIDIQWHGRVYPSSIVIDQALRIATVGAVNRSAVLPPQDPFLRLGTAIPLGYHYFWYVLCDLVCREAPNWIGSRGSIMAGTVWMGLALWAILSLWLKSVREEKTGIATRWILAAFLLSISGIDALAFFLLILRRLVWHFPQWLPFPTMDWWSNDQVTNWLDIMVWVPHCSASLIACATGLLVLLLCPDGDRKRRLIAVLVAGACFASSAGMSIYVAFGFAVAIGCYVVFLAIRKEWTRVVPLALSGLVALILVAPFLVELRRNVASPGFLHIGLRLVPVQVLPVTIQHLIGRRLGYLLYAPGLAITLFIEFGFWAVAAVYWWRMQRSHPKPFRSWLLIFLSISSLVLTSVARSDLTNDLGMRAIFCGQFALAVMAGEWLLYRLRELRIGSVLNRLKALPSLSLILLLGGGFTTIAEATLLRTYPMLQDLNVVMYKFIFWPHLGRSVASTRTAYEWLKKHSDPHAIVQLAPSEDAVYFVGSYSGRQTAVTGEYQLQYRAKYKSELEFAMKDIEKIFCGKQASLSNVASICSRWSINYLVVTSHDPVWVSRKSWIWQESPLYENAMARVYACSSIQPR